MVTWWDIYFIGSIVLSQLSEEALHRCPRLVEKEMKSESVNRSYHPHNVYVVKPQEKDPVIAITEAIGSQGF